MTQCNCFEIGDDLGDFIVMYYQPLIEITSDEKHIYVDDKLVWCGNQ